MTLSVVIVMIVLIWLRGLAAQQLKYHYDRANISDLTGKWEGMRDRRLRDRAARIIGRQ